MVLDVKVYAEMLWKKSDAVPEGNGPIPQDACVMLVGTTREKLRRVMSKTIGKALEEFKEDMRRVNQGLASLEQDGWQPRLAIEADVTAYKKTHERTEGAAAQFKRSMGIDVLQKGSKPVRPIRPVTAIKLNLPLSLAGMTSWSTMALRRQSRVFHPWRCTR